MRPTRSTLRHGLIALALAAALTGCGGGSGEEATPVARVDADAPPLHSFELYALGSERGNELQADLYGLTLNPLRAYRLTAGKRVSWLSANANTIVVAAADQQIDKLGLIAEGGEIVPIPGLGRLPAYSPEIQPDGAIRYQDSGPGEAFTPRYLSFDPRTGKKRVLFTTKDEEVSIVAAGPGGGFLAVVQETDRDDQILLMDWDGIRDAITIAPQIASPESGKALISVGVYSSPDLDAPSDTALLNPKTKKVRIVKGWAPLGWAPGGTRLLVVRTSEADLPDAELAVLDPATSDEPQILGTIPGLTFFSASWVDRTAS